ncbi:MAG: hypothetical protein RMM58_09765 [Chloroflexota bacterium]|nr:hypothetical protein [Dehalococcoidia bacterium]MDW8254155.1 hypothetical protein [Chloroflexota bacterium]
MASTGVEGVNCAARKREQRADPAAAAILCLLLLGRTAAAALLYRSGYESISGDGYLRTLLAADWAAQPYIAASGVWLPGHMIALGSVLLLVNDLILIPRLFSVALGLVAIVLVAAIGAALFRDWRAGVLAALALAASPAHLWVSATPLSENLTLALLLAGLLAVVRFDRGGARGWVAVAGGAFALANAVRYEAWLVSAVFGALVLWWVAGGRLPPVAALAPGAAGLVPLAVILANGVTFGDPFFWPNAFRAYNLRTYGPGPDIVGVAEALWTAEGPLLIVILAAALWAARHTPPVRHYLLLAGFPSLTLIVGLAASREPFNNHLRYLVPALVVFLPLVGGCAAAFWERTRHRVGLAVAALVVGAGLLGGRLAAAGAPPAEPSNAGFAVGRQIAALRQSGQLPAGPLIVESSTLAVYAMMVGANDIEGILLDRSPDPTRSLPPIVGLGHAELAACVGQAGAVGIVASSVDPRQLPGAHPVAVVNGYWIARVEPARGQCPGDPARWPDFAREATGRLFAALAYRRNE